MAKVIVIGGGASGVIAALQASINNEVTILEHNSVLCKKILVTGNGHCNYWHENINISNYHSTDNNLIKDIINESNLRQALNILNKIGIIPKIKNGYYYPHSNQAISVQNALINAVKKSNINVITDCEVEDLYKTNKFNIRTSKGLYEADIVILATGGNSTIKTSSVGIGYKLATALGHKLIKPLPALVQLISSNKELKEVSGVRSDVLLTLVEDGNKIATEIGELQHTEYGISGICAMQLSSKIARGLDENKEEKILINYIPSIATSINEFKKWLNNYKVNLNTITISELLDQLLNYKLTNMILKNNKIDPQKNINDLNEYEITKISKDLIEYEIFITGTNSFEHAQTTSGGIPLNEINCQTLESKIVKKLYFCGEIIDIDGECGGYNLALAWVTGYIVGNNINKGAKHDNN